ncbi:hypothetical protein NPIRD3C_1881 [Nitrosopumilus piranensis]|uniref:Uncharacterized protein n=1 Tax=Nitrosopumilus piranensis TaxID=1582439 RepID=A0A0C5BXR2_9ARCH|nr:hypothetical protein NPIRD3C_1881 [Nitrosopumilus piranensis]
MNIPITIKATRTNRSYKFSVFPKYQIDKHNAETVTRQLIIVGLKFRF